MPRPLRNPSGIALHHILYALIVIAIVVFAVTRFTEREGAANTGEPAPTAPGTAASDPTLLDPAPYRGTIQQIEALLYQAGPAELGDAERVSRLVTQVGTALLRAPNRLQGQRAGREVMALGTRLSQTTDAGYGTLDLPRARADWLRVRDKLFRPAPWFRKNTN